MTTFITTEILYAIYNGYDYVQVAQPQENCLLVNSKKNPNNTTSYFLKDGTDITYYFIPLGVRALLHDPVPLRKPTPKASAHVTSTSSLDQFKDLFNIIKTTANLGIKTIEKMNHSTAGSAYDEDKTVDNYDEETVDLSRIGAINNTELEYNSYRSLADYIPGSNDFSYIDFPGTGINFILSKSQKNQPFFTGLDLTGFNFSYAILSNHLSFAGTKLQFTNFTGTIFNGATINTADFSYSIIKNADFRNTDLSLATIANIIDIEISLVTINANTKLPTNVYFFQNLQIKSKSIDGSKTGYFYGPNLPTRNGTVYCPLKPPSTNSGWDFPFFVYY